MFFFVIIKNLNWEILTKNLVPFKGWDGVKDEKFEYYEGSVKNPIFRGKVHEKPIYRGELPKKGRAWTVGRFKGELGEKEEGGVFEDGGGGGGGGGVIPQCTV